MNKNKNIDEDIIFINFDTNNINEPFINTK